MPQLLRTQAEVRARVAALARDGRSLALVPTMGALHEGHLSLMREGKRRADVCAASIFVNPTQFGPAEDLSRYPRDEADDLVKCGAAGVDFVWAPSVEEVYPPGHQTFVEVTELTRGLCGARRPGHFRGVTTVVAKLLALFRPTLALFGEKDWQQLQVVSRTNADLGLGVEIVGMPIVREADGLALSSRNAYLSPDERRRALALSRGLRAAAAARHEGETRVEVLKRVAASELDQATLVTDYVELVGANDLVPFADDARLDRPARLLVAAFVGKTRLIDNTGL